MYLSNDVSFQCVLSRAFFPTILVRCSVLVFMGDNGGPLDGAHSNFPLRGGKLNFFEGGVRPTAFVHSPLLPAAVAGTTYEGILHETDWYAWRPRRPVLWGPPCAGGKRLILTAFPPNRVRPHPRSRPATYISY